MDEMGQMDERKVFMVLSIVADQVDKLIAEIEILKEEVELSRTPKIMTEPKKPK